MFSRREILSSFLGASVALAACRKKRKPPHYSGELLGPDVRRGHLLRTPPPTLTQDIREERYRVAIIGGGPAGLSAAWRLKHAGLSPKEFALFELESETGGTSRGGISQVSRFPWGAHYVPVPQAHARALNTLLEEMNLLEGYDDTHQPIVREEVLCRAPEERLYHQGYWYEGLFLHAGSTKDDWDQLARFRKELSRWAAYRDKSNRPAFAIPSAMASRDDEVLALDHISMAQWLDERNFHSTRLRWLVDYACRDDYGLSVQDTSAWAALFYFVSRQGADSHSAPLMTWPDGNGHIARYLASTVSGSIRTGYLATDIRLRADRLCEILLSSEKNEQLRVLADHVIVAVPRYVARHICAPLRHRSEEKLALENKAFDYGAWAVCALHMRDRPRSRGVPFAWDNVIYQSKALGYVVSTHQMGIDRGPSVWTWYYAITDAGATSRERLLQASWKDWADVAVTDLATPHPDLYGMLDRVDVWRWGHAMVRPRIGAHRALIELLNDHPSSRMSFAHTDLSGIALFEEAQDHGVRAAEEALITLGIQSRSMRIPFL